MNDLGFEAGVEGHKLCMDTSHEHGGKNLGTRPKPLMIVALAGLSGTKYCGGSANYLKGRTELFKEPDIVFEIEPKVSDLVNKHGNPLDSHSKRITCIFN